MNGNWGALVAGWVLGLSLVSACGQTTSSPALGGETHWLQECGPGAARPAGGCGPGLVCSCGMCMAPCSDDGACRALGDDAICADTSTTEYADACATGELPRACVSSLSAPPSSELTNPPVPDSIESTGSGTPPSTPATVPPPWACLDELPPPPNTGLNPAFIYSAAVLDYRSLSPLDGASLRACLITDFLCELGVSEGVRDAPSFARPPRTTVSLPIGFEGFLRITAPDYVTLDYYVGGPVRQDVVAPPFMLFTEATLAELALDLGVGDTEGARSRGMVLFQVLDCNLDPARDVQLRLPDQDQNPELRDVLPWGTSSRILVANMPTDGDGIAGFFGVPPGNHVVEAVVEGRAFGRRIIRVDENSVTAGTLRVNYDIGY